MSLEADELSRAIFYVWGERAAWGVPTDNSMLVEDTRLRYLDKAPKALARAMPRFDPYRGTKEFSFAVSICKRVLREAFDKTRKKSARTVPMDHLTLDRVTNLMDMERVREDKRIEQMVRAEMQRLFPDSFFGLKLPDGRDFTPREAEAAGLFVFERKRFDGDGTWGYREAQGAWDHRDYDGVIQLIQTRDTAIHPRALLYREIAEVMKRGADGRKVSTEAARQYVSSAGKKLHITPDKIHAAVFEGLYHTRVRAKVTHDIVREVRDDPFEGLAYTRPLIG